VKLTVNFIGSGKYYRAFVDDVPEDELPERIRKYAVPADNGEADVGRIPPTSSKGIAALASLGSEDLGNSPDPPKPIVPRKYVKRGAVYRRAKQVQLRIGEPLYIKQLGEFVEVGKVKGVKPALNASPGRSATMTPGNDQKPHTAAPEGKKAPGQSVLQHAPIQNLNIG
jgi:hypothetical protein